MRLKDLPALEFVSADKSVIEAQMFEVYRRITGRTLAKADPVRLFVLFMANVVILLLNKFNETGKQNMLAYATHEKLEHIGILVGVTRTPATAAVTTVLFTASKNAETEIIIPKGTRVTAGDNMFFAVRETGVIAANESNVTLKATCLTAGEAGNGYTIGKLTTLVDPIPYIASVTNTTISEGGADAEGDEAFRLRIQEAPESFSVAGPVGAYEYWAKTASTKITDVKVTSPVPGEVVIYPLLEGGEIPQEEIKQKVLDTCNDEAIRPLTDKISVQAPSVKEYSINLKYYLWKEDVADIDRIKEAVQKAVDTFVLWQKEIMGRDINPSELTRLIMRAGAKRVEIVEPVFIPVKGGAKEDSYTVEVAVCKSRTITYGGAEDE